MYEYNAELKKVVDGDTIDLIVDLGFSTKLEWRFRLVGIDTPETWRPTTAGEKEHGERAKEFTTKELTGKKLVIKSFKMGAYARYSCEIIYDGKNLTEELKKNGFEKRASYEGFLV
jgi:micrococcal nuclease